MSSLQSLQEWYDRVWVQQDLDVIHTLFTPDIEAQGMIDFGVGPDDFRVLTEAVLALVEVTEIRFNRTVEMGDWVWGTYTADAVTLANRAPVDATGQIMARFKDGRIVEAYNQVDFLTFFEKLGYLPPDSLALCLSGEGVAA